jgi:hypothetical protein
VAVPTAFVEPTDGVVPELILVPVLLLLLLLPLLELELELELLVELDCSILV